MSSENVRICKRGYDFPSGVCQGLHACMGAGCILIFHSLLIYQPFLRVSCTQRHSWLGQAEKRNRREQLPSTNHSATPQYPLPLNPSSPPFLPKSPLVDFLSLQGLKNFETSQNKKEFPLSFLPPQIFQHAPSSTGPQTPLVLTLMLIETAGILAANPHLTAYSRHAITFDVDGGREQRTILNLRLLLGMGDILWGRRWRY